MAREFSKNEYDNTAERLGDRLFAMVDTLSDKKVDQKIKDGSLMSSKVAIVISYSAPNVTIRLPEDNTTFTRRCLLLVRNDGLGNLSANFPTNGDTVRLVQWGENFSQSFAVYLG